MKKILSTILGLLIVSPILAFGASVFLPVQGGTGISTIPTYGQVLVGNAGGTYTLTATSSLGFPTTFSFPFTSQSWGNSTSTTLGFLNGFLSTASSTINSSFHLPTLADGMMTVYSGLVGSYATTTFNSPLTYSGGSATIQSSSVIQDGSMASTSVVQLLNARSTSWLSGGKLSINADPTKFNITAGTGVVVDNVTNPVAPTITYVKWPTQTDIAATRLSVDTVTRLMIDSSGVIHQFAEPFVATTSRAMFTIGFLGHSPSGIFGVSQAVNVIDLNNSVNLGEMARAIGSINISGNVYSANGANLSMNLSAGSQFVLAANNQDLADPNISSTTAQSPVTFYYSWRNGSGGYTLSAATTTVWSYNYDDGTGGSPLPNGAVPSGDYTIQRIWFSPPTATTIVEYAQNLYTSLAAAQAAIASEAFVDNPDAAALSFRGWLIMKRNTSALNDTTKAVFVAAGKFGLSAFGGVAGGNTNLQGAYNNSVQPQVITNSTAGAIQFERGSAADTDHVFDILNGAGTITDAFFGDGLASTSRATTTQMTVWGNMWHKGLSAGGMGIDSNGLTYTGATTTFSCGSGVSCTYAGGVESFTGSATAFPFTPTTNYNTAVNSTSTPIWFTTGLMASSTSYFANATTSLFTDLGTIWLPSLTSSGLGVDANGKVYAAATTTFSNGLAYLGGVASIASIAANSILGTYTAGVPSAIATSSLFAAGTAGNVLTYTSAGTWVPSATTTFSSPLTYAGGAVTCNVASGSQAGCLSSTDWTTFNGKSGFAFPWTPTANFAVNTNATSTAMSFLGGLNASSTSRIDTTWFTGGKVGIASTSPQYTLGINSAAGVDPFNIGSSTGTLLAVNQWGGVQVAASQPATTTTITLDWGKTSRQVEYQMLNSAFTINVINATTSQWWGSTKIVYVCNGASAAGAITWTGIELVGTAPTQTTTANQCDVYSFDVTHATSTSAYKVAGSQGAGFQ